MRSSGVRIGAALLSGGTVVFCADEPAEPEKKLYPNTWDDDWDHRKHLKRKDAKSTSVRHIYLIRHGQYTSAKTDEGMKLTDLGRRQATLTGQRLKATGLTFNKIYYRSAASFSRAQ
jgi:hypothetical protein